MEPETEDEDNRREAAIASRPSLKDNFKASAVTQAQLSKFQELHKRRLQIKSRAKIKNKAKGKSNEASKSRMKNLDFIEEVSSKETEDSGVSILKGNAIKNTVSPQKENEAVHFGAMKRQKLHWGLDTKERWERKANM
ncbi:hypothetical protein U1Q18_038745 [Sarracenia purpurea var. burkii]